MTLYFHKTEMRQFKSPTFLPVYFRPFSYPPRPASKIEFSNNSRCMSFYNFSDAISSKVNGTVVNHLSIYDGRTHFSTLNWYVQMKITKSYR